MSGNAYMRLNDAVVELMRRGLTGDQVKDVVAEIVTDLRSADSASENTAASPRKESDA